MYKCPKCGSPAVNQYRMPTGPMWCTACNFRVNDKTAYPNPFTNISQSNKQTRLEILQEFYDAVKEQIDGGSYFMNLAFRASDAEEICTRKLSDLSEE